MAELIDEAARVTCQGFTGSQGTLHSEHAITYGANVEEGKAIINGSDVDVIAADDLKDGAQKIVAAVKG